MAKNIHNLIKNYSIINQRLSELMKAKGINISSLSRQADVAIGTIQKLMTDPSCNPTISSLEAICKALDVSLSELIGQDQRANNLYGSNVILLDWDELLFSCSKIQNIVEHPAQQREMIKTSCIVGKDAFALKMRDHSMLPLFPENTILIFDPDKPAKGGHYVMVYIKQYNNALFKQLLIDEPYKYIKSINPVFNDNIIKLEIQDTIIAPLVQAQIQY